MARRQTEHIRPGEVGQRVQCRILEHDRFGDSKLDDQCLHRREVGSIVVDDHPVRNLSDYAGMCASNTS